MKVDIYLETDKQSQGCTKRKYGYVIQAMRNGEPETRDGFGTITGTYHQSNLHALSDALERFHAKCQICIHTKDAFVAARILRISDMEAAGYKDTKGKQIRNAEEWGDLYKKISKYEFEITSATGKHEYSEWLQEEMKKYEVG